LEREEIQGITTKKSAGLLFVFVNDLFFVVNFLSILDSSCSQGFVPEFFPSWCSS